MSKIRLSVTVDAALAEAAEQLVNAGAAESLSAWVNDALRAKLEHDRRLGALKAAVEAYEAAHGVITDEEIAMQRKADRAAAIVVRGSGHARSKRRPASRRGAA